MFDIPAGLNGKVSKGAVAAALVNGLRNKYLGDEVSSKYLDRMAHDIHVTMREIKERGDVVWDSERDSEVVGFTTVVYRDRPGHVDLIAQQRPVS